MRPAFFETRGVSFSYRPGRPGLRDISFRVEKSEKVAILGANGSGKSTLLKLLDGLIFPGEGEIRFDGRLLSESGFRDPQTNRDFRSRVGLVFQNPDSQLFCSTVEEEIAFGPLQLGLSQADVRQRTSEVLDLLRLTPLAGVPPYELSGGEKKRVAIGAVLATNPQVILLDEPTNALDPRSRWDLVDLLVDLHAAGKTLVTATNDMEVVQAIADRLLILGEDKTILAEGPAAKLLADTDLLEKANLIHVHKHSHGGQEHRHVHTHPGHLREHHSESD